MAGIGAAVSGENGERLNQGSPAEDGDVGQLRCGDARREDTSSDAMAREQLEGYLVALQGSSGDVTYEFLRLFPGPPSPAVAGEETTAQIREHRPGI